MQAAPCADAVASPSSLLRHSISWRGSNPTTQGPHGGGAWMPRAPNLMERCTGHCCSGRWTQGLHETSWGLIPELHIGLAEGFCPRSGQGQLAQTLGWYGPCTRSRHPSCLKVQGSRCWGAWGGAGELGEVLGDSGRSWGRQEGAEILGKALGDSGRCWGIRGTQEGDGELRAR